MFEWLEHYINNERWHYAVDCVVTMYGMQITSSSTGAPSGSNSVRTPTSQ